MKVYRAYEQDYEWEDTLGIYATRVEAEDSIRRFTEAGKITGRSLKVEEFELSIDAWKS